MSEIKGPVLLDTSAIIEFLDRTPKGVKVKSFIDKSELLLVPTIVLAELTTKLERKGFKVEDYLTVIQKAASVLLLDSNIAIKAGKIHAKLHKEDPTVSLADCIIIAHSEIENATIITTDNHFASIQNALVIS